MVPLSELENFEYQIFSRFHFELNNQYVHFNNQYVNICSENDVDTRLSSQQKQFVHALYQKEFLPDNIDFPKQLQFLLF